MPADAHSHCMSITFFLSNDITHPSAHFALAVERYFFSFTPEILFQYSIVPQVAPTINLQKLWEVYHIICLWAIYCQLLLQRTAYFRKKFYYTLPTKYFKRGIDFAYWFFLCMYLFQLTIEIQTWGP